MKKAFALMLALCMTFSFASALAEQYTLKIGHAQGDTHVRHVSLLAFEKMVE